MALVINNMDSNPITKLPNVDLGLGGNVLSSYKNMDKLISNKPKLDIELNQSQFTDTNIVDKVNTAVKKVRHFVKSSKFKTYKDELGSLYETLKSRGIEDTANELASELYVKNKSTIKNNAILNSLVKNLCNDPNGSLSISNMGSLLSKYSQGLTELLSCSLNSHGLFNVAKDVLSSTVTDKKLKKGIIRGMSKGKFDFTAYKDIVNSSTSRDLFKESIKNLKKFTENNDKTLIEKNDNNKEETATLLINEISKKNLYKSNSPITDKRIMTVVKSRASSEPSIDDVKSYILFKKIKQQAVT